MAFTVYSHSIIIKQVVSCLGPYDVFFFFFLGLMFCTMIHLWCIFCPMFHAVQCVFLLSFLGSVNHSGNGWDERLSWRITSVLSVLMLLPGIIDRLQSRTTVNKGSQQIKNQYLFFFSNLYNMIWLAFNIKVVSGCQCMALKGLLLIKQMY